MAAYCRVYDSRHLQADCREPGSALEPYVRQSSMGYLFKSETYGEGESTGQLAQCLYVCFLKAISRGVHFEILYSPMIRDASARRSTITNANLLVELCRGKVSIGSVMSH